MKMVKSLLLGSAAGVVAVAGAQAADLPVKAKPVEYVKICSLYGDGFYYIPGTDICIRVGGYIMADYYWNTMGNGGNQPTYGNAAGSFDRSHSHFNTKNRANVQMDTRMQTAYGTLRTFTSLHFTNGSVTDSFNPARAFIQFAGFTFGRSVSFADVPGDFSDGYLQNILQPQHASNTGANGVNQIAYTFDLGNGMTLTAGADERRVKSLSNLSTASWTVGAEPSTARGGDLIPDPYLAFKVNQAWGQFGITGIGHFNNAQYYTSAAGIGPALGAGTPCAAGGTGVNANTGTTLCGHPQDEWGGAVQAGIWINTPFGNGNQDHFGVSGQFGIGATGYGGGNNMLSPTVYGTGNQIAFGANSDAVYINGSSMQLTTSWAAEGGYEHWWAPTFRTTAFAGFSQISYNNTVKSGRWFCNGGGPGTAVLAGQGIGVGAATACDPGYVAWTAGAHADWYPVKQLRLGLEGQFMGIETAMNNQVVTLPKFQDRPAGVYTAKNMGVVSGVFRARKDF